MKRVYLDWAAAAAASKAAERAFARASRAFGNPSSAHEEGRAAASVLEDARVRIARLVGVKADAIVFASGATEANALALRGHAAALAKEGRDLADAEVLFMPSQHASVLGALRELEAAGATLVPIAFKDGRIDLEAFTRSLTPKTVLATIDAVCGETGAVHAARDLRRALDAYGKAHATRIRLHVDASQAPRAIAFDLPRLGADLLTLDAQKVGGVRGTGVLVAPRSVPLAPLFHGGGQERSLRPGTESPALASALATALEETAADRDRFRMHALRAREAFVAKVLDAVPDTLVNEGREQAPHILNLSFPGRDTDYLAALMDEAGFAVSTKSACESDGEEGSRAVLYQTEDAVRAASTLRISWGSTTSDRDLLRAADALIRSVRFIDAHAMHDAQKSVDAI